MDHSSSLVVVQRGSDEQLNVVNPPVPACDVACKRRSSAGQSDRPCAGRCPGACKAKTALRPLSCLQIGSGWFAEQPGGLERYYRDLLHHLPGSSVTSSGMVIGSDRVATDTGGTIQAFASASQGLLSRLKAGRRGAAAKQNQGLDLIASHFALYALSALPVFKELPWVIHFHGPWSLESRSNLRGRVASSLKFAVEKRVYRRGSKFITLSDAFARVLREQYDVPEEKISVIPGGVDIERFAISESRAVARRILGLPLDRPIVLAVRRLVPRMGLENLIAAASSRALRDTVFVIAGSGPLLERLKHQAGRVDKRDTQIRFLGRVPDEQLPLLYRAADLTVVPSLKLEGFGLICVESLAAGTPVVVTPVGGLPEVVAGLSQSLITEGTSADLLAEAIRRALFGNGRLPGAQACEQYARSNFDWRNIAYRVRQVYEQAVTTH